MQPPPRRVSLLRFWRQSVRHLRALQPGLSKRDAAAIALNAARQRFKSQPGYHRDRHLPDRWR